ncbi:MAG: N-acetyltransferase [Sulfurovum sp.]|nr:MAG: N-acetyltransferase [Sulfurovum sp.]
MSEHVLKHNQKENKYEFHIDGHIAYITYDNQDGVLHLTHTIVPDALAGKGLAKKLTIAVMNEIELQGLKVQPQCSYIVAFMEKNPEYQHLQG